MHNLHSLAKALAGSLLSGVSATLAWVSIKDAQVIMAIGASLAAVISGLLSARLSWYSSQEKKEILRKLKSKSNEPVSK